MFRRFGSACVLVVMLWLAVSAGCSRCELAICRDIDEPRSDLFPRDKLLRVALELPAAEWERLRRQGPSMNDVYSNCASAEPGEPADALVQIEDAEAVPARVYKNTLLWTQGARKPGLRIVLESGREIVLDNNLPGANPFGPAAAACLAYATFAAAGVPAPRCSLASLTVNGEAIATYVHVEAIDKAFLARELGDARGTLHHGLSTADFRPDLATNLLPPAAASGSVARLVELLAAPQTDDNWLQQLAAVVDLEQFMRFWATEVLIAHWNGYTGNLSNFYVYEQPRTHKLIFIPSGAVTAFQSGHGFLRQPLPPRSVLAWARLPRALYAIEAQRERFRATLRELLDEHWDESALLAEVSRIEVLLGASGSPAELDALRVFIEGRRAQLQAELDAPAPAWTIPERPTPQCEPSRNSFIGANVRATWGNLDMLALVPGNTLDVELDGERVTSPTVLSAAGDAGRLGASVSLAALLDDGGPPLIVSLRLGPTPTAAGEVFFQGSDIYGAVVRGSGANQYEFIGFIGAGKLVIEEAPGQVLSGRLDAQLVTIEPWLAANYRLP